jgi:hypothetical protein
MWLAGAEGPMDMAEGFEPAVAGIGDELTLTGGKLPPQAVRAVVCDHAGGEHHATCGHGAWLAILPGRCAEDAPPVRFLDRDGELVAVPIPRGVELEQIEDTGEPCPACAAVAWQRVVRTPRWRCNRDSRLVRGPHDDKRSTAGCGCCGYVQRLRVMFGPGLSPMMPGRRSGHRARSRARRAVGAF